VRPTLEQKVTPLEAAIVCPITIGREPQLLLCLTLSLSGNGEGLGTLGLHEPKLRDLGLEAGFSSVRRIPMDNPFNSLYELTP